MKRRLTILITALALLPLLLAGGGFGLFLLRKSGPDAPVTIHVASGSAFGTVARDLQRTGVVSSTICFKLLARLRGDAAAIQAGDYRFASRATPGRILDRLVAGDVVRHQLTIPEGFSRQEIVQRLRESDFPDAAAFLPLTDDPAFINSLGIKAVSLEGYLFPETYTYDSRTNARQLIRAMVDQCRAELPPALLAKAKQQGLDRHQLLTLASIIQKEAGNNAEMPLISAVFHNRLQRGIALQADPTVIYGIKDFDGNLTRRHLQEITPYNTYRVPGLPPGPIASPGRAALQAAANPAAVKYLYFVARGDGTHQFSSTLREHNAAVRKYQLKR
jgi:UPF0755 protein